ncbi:MAG: PD40 domain-containing protein [Planctomycetes bacterium]|nr:PD40 domain-containing protein [Planctomycetota bacterium]
MSARLHVRPLALLALSLGAAAQSTTRVSVSSSGAEGNQFSEAPSISLDATRVAFSSIASTLVPNDTNNFDDVFVRDRSSGVTLRVSVSSSGAQSDGTSWEPALSADGRVVAFRSGATNLDPLDTNGVADVYVHDLTTGTTVRVSVASSGAQANGSSSTPALSADGRYVAFYSTASNLVAGDTNGFWDIFVHDRQAHTTLRASLTSSGAQPSNNCGGPALSADGRYVAFHSNAANLVPGDTNASADIFVRDLLLSTTTRVSLTSLGVQANGSSADPQLSADGRFVVFHSAATNLAPSDTNLREDVFVHDRQLGTTARVSVATGGAEADSTSRKARISADGRVIAFESLAQNLDASDNNNTWDAFVHDRLSGVTERVSVDDQGVEGDGTSSLPSISGTGRYVAFSSYASNLVAFDLNNTADIFVRDRGAEQPVAYCTAGTTSAGCVPAIGASGTPSAAASSGFTLTVSALEGQRAGLLFYGTSGSSAWPWAASSTSFMCVKQPTQRLPLQNSGGTSAACNGAFASDCLAFMAANPSALGQPLTPGATFYAQAWFRDPPAAKSTNLSNALMFTLVP